MLWSPASSFWGRLLNYEADRALVADDNPSIVRTPLVIAMWKRLADAYGYPRRPLGYRAARRARDRRLGRRGQPQFGAFKYVHTNPDFSTSGLSAVAASYYAAVGKREGLTEADVAPRRAQQVRRLERSIVHYGDTTLFISERDAPPRARLRVGRRHGGDHADRTSTGAPATASGSWRCIRRRGRSSRTTR